jgi:hypothetical protein
MNDKQLTPGDLALVIKSVTGKAMGKIVECIQIIGTDPNFGTIWLVKSPNKIEAYHDGAQSNQSHMPQDWLRKIPRDPLPDEEDLYSLDSTKELEKT